MEHRYRPRGVCSNELIFQIYGTIIKNLKIIGGCPGNTVGVARLVQDREITESQSRFSRSILRAGCACYPSSTKYICTSQVHPRGAL